MVASLAGLGEQWRDQRDARAVALGFVGQAVQLLGGESQRRGVLGGAEATGDRPHL